MSAIPTATRAAANTPHGFPANRLLPYAEETGLPANSDRDTLLRWLAWNDRNGVYLDSDTWAEFGDLTSWRDAWLLVMLACDGEFPPELEPDPR
jgi:hypothetical protein